MKRFIFALLASSTMLGAYAQEKTDSVEGFVFTDEITIPVTSVKDQNKSGTCWCFSGTSFFENEIRKAGGDSLDLSEMFTVRHCYLDKADRYVRMYGSANFAAGGSILDVPYVWRRYGAVPEEVYSGLQYGEDKHVHGELDGILKSYVDVIVSKPNKKISTAWRKGFEAVLDAYLGPVPEKFTYKGKEYTPQSYAASLGIDPDNYIALTSFTHHPFYEDFIFEVPDNWLWASYTNIPMDELKAVVDNALANGYTVAWAADVSEGGFKWTDGVAILPKGKDEKDMDGTELSRWVHLSDKDRQNERGMEIVGTARDQKGNRYYKVKNSWDTNQKYDGYLYVSEPFFLAKTLNLLVNKKAVPASIAKKIGLK